LVVSLFDESSFVDLYFDNFLKSDLGKIYQSVPWQRLADYFSPYKSFSPFGRKARFTISGGLGLMFLKHYTGLSDERVIARLNTDWHFQFFCGIRLSPCEQIKDKDTVGRWRRFFGEHMDIDKLQDIFSSHWSAYMIEKDTLLDDATCYESYIKYPTDVKLLFDCTEYLFNTIGELCEGYNIKKPRSKYGFQANRQISYQKLKRKPHKRTRRRQKQLLYWVNRGLELLQEILNRYPEVHTNSKLIYPIYDKIKLIRIIYVQQQFHYLHPKQSIKRRIVSFYKPYIRPIIRGKENKKVEFGAKVHVSQVDQINFIEHLSFEAFHEGVRMWKSVLKHKKRFTKCKNYGGDKIYANNKNRKFAKNRKINTCFVPKGRRGKNEKQAKILRQAIAKARATRLEGSFGNEKNHYSLKKVKARTQKTEIAWIFFGIHTANAVKISKRLKPPDQVKAA